VVGESEVSAGGREERERVVTVELLPVCLEELLELAAVVEDQDEAARGLSDRRRSRRCWSACADGPDLEPEPGPERADLLTGVDKGGDDGEPGVWWWWWSGDDEEENAEEDVGGGGGIDKSKRWSRIDTSFDPVSTFLARFPK